MNERKDEIEPATNKLPAWYNPWANAGNDEFIFSFMHDAFKFTFRQINSFRIMDDRDPMSSSEKILFVIRTLSSKQKIEDLVKTYSSVNYGADILNKVFPKDVNPMEYHSTDISIRLDEHPVQVIGWREYEKLVLEGVEMGLDRDMIISGFFIKADQRGINLEWSFFPEVPTVKKDHQTTNLLP